MSNDWKVTFDASVVRRWLVNAFLWGMVIGQVAQILVFLFVWAVA